MSETVAKVVRVATGEYLGLVFQSAESPRMNDTIAVTLEIIAIRVLRLGIAPSATLFCTEGVGSEHGKSLPQWVIGQSGVILLLRHNQITQLPTFSIT